MSKTFSFVVCREIILLFYVFSAVFFHFFCNVFEFEIAATQNLASILCFFIVFSSVSSKTLTVTSLFSTVFSFMFRENVLVLLFLYFLCFFNFFFLKNGCFAYLFFIMIVKFFVIEMEYEKQDVNGFCRWKFFFLNFTRGGSGKRHVSNMLVNERNFRNYSQLVIMVYMLRKFKYLIWWENTGIRNFWNYYIIFYR